MAAPNLALWDELNPLQAMVAAQLFQKRRLLLAMPRQEGKTELGVRLGRDVMLRSALMERPSSGIFLAKDRKSAKKATREKFMRLCPRELFAVNTEQVYLKAFPTAIQYIDSVDKDPERIRGGTYDWIHWSEVAFSKLEQGVAVKDVFERILKFTQRKTGGYALLESTMNGRNGWKDLWDNADQLGFSKIRIRLSDMLRMGLITQADFDAEKAENHPLVFQQELECEFVSFQGRTYPEFEERHIWPDMPGPSDWQLVVSAIDWGYHPSATCVLFGYVQGGVLCVFDEYHKREEIGLITGDKIQEKKAFWDIQRMAAVADHDKARVAELEMRGIPCSLAVKSNVQGNRIQIKELLHFDKLRIHPRCQNLIRELEIAVWDPKKEGEIDYGQDSEGHMDSEAALRYLVRALHGAETIKPKRNPHKAVDPVSAMAWQIEQQREEDDHGNHAG